MITLFNDISGLLNCNSIVSIKLYVHFISSLSPNLLYGVPLTHTHYQIHHKLKKKNCLLKLLSADERILN